MYCLKCGKDTKSEKIFCEDCLEGMDQYPVKPGTAIQLHKREPIAVTRKAAKAARSYTPEEQISHLRRVVLWLGILLLVTVALLAFVTILLYTDQQAFPMLRHFTSPANVSRETFLGNILL